MAILLSVSWVSNTYDIVETRIRSLKCTRLVLVAFRVYDDPNGETTTKTRRAHFEHSRSRRNTSRSSEIYPCRFGRSSRSCRRNRRKRDQNEKGRFRPPPLLPAPKWPKSLRYAAIYTKSLPYAAFFQGYFEKWLKSLCYAYTWTEAFRYSAIFSSRSCKMLQILTLRVHFDEIPTLLSHFFHLRATFSYGDEKV